MSVPAVGGEESVVVDLHVAAKRRGHQLLSQAGVYGPRESTAGEKLQQSFFEGANEDGRPCEFQDRSVGSRILQRHALRPSCRRPRAGKR
jgi:hypothetical protein